VRIKDWRIVFLSLLTCGIIEKSFAGSNSTTPLYHHTDPLVEREFQNSYQTMSRAPAIFTGAGAPAFAPSKVGDTYISTSTQKIYISTATATKASWMIVN
jgi:hypothetical protein